MPSTTSHDKKVLTRTFPAWIRRLPGAADQHEELVKLGWNALHAAALSSCASTKVTTAGKTFRVRVATYQTHLIQFPDRLGVTPPALHRRTEWQYFGRKISEILSNEAAHGRVKGRYCILQNALLSSRPGKISFHNPNDLLNTAYKALKTLKSSNIKECDLLFLALIGMAVLGLISMQGCEICFRWAIPGHHFCQLHSQSIEAPGTRQSKAKGYRNGLKVAEVFRKHNSSQGENGSEFALSKIPILIARQLFGATLPHEERIIESIKGKINRNPEVLRILGDGIQKLTGEKFYARLRERLDPYTWLPTVWPSKIRAASRWLLLEKEQCPGVRGSSLKTSSRIRRAIELIELGHQKKDIAKELGLSPSALSNWAKRGRILELGALYISHTEERTRLIKARKDLLKILWEQ